MKIEVVVNGTQIQWYRSKGYEIPMIKTQLYYIDKNGNRYKNGHKYRIRKGTKILVDVADLPPKSNQIVNYTCIVCGLNCTTTWQAFQKKHTPDKCRECKKKEIKGTGCYTYWVDQLITKNEFAECDISGERDKRFLILHHLLSRKYCGKDEKSNYVVLSANYHLAFHNWNGGMSVPCTPDQYYKFKAQEMIKIKGLLKVV